LNWLWGAGRTNGEGVERGWAHLGLIATSTRDMGPGSRHGTMNDHFGNWNWIKLTGLGHLLQKRLKNAVEERDFCRQELEAFSMGRRAEAVKWGEDIMRWEEDQEKSASEREGALNPYEMPKAGMLRVLGLSFDSNCSFRYV
ncbi:hypothetical protein BT96DRAFT_823805, partial [Gymnopus androsaceus JB14]